MELPPALEPSSPSSPTALDSVHWPLVFHSAASSVPLASKGNRGEDAFFTASMAMGVADGVGGWSLVGVDSGLYSRQLMEHAREMAVRESSKRVPHPRDIMQNAYNLMPQTMLGTTTATICTLSGGKLKISNLGDSGCLVLRFAAMSWSWVPVLRTREQTHYFNCPCQLGTDADDFPADADNYELDVQENDLIVLCTDGVFDNLFDEDIAACLAPFVNVIHSKFDLQAAANAVVQTAIKTSESVLAQTPFSKGAFANGLVHSGGKQDDVTCVVGLVVSDVYQGDIVMETVSSTAESAVSAVMCTPASKRHSY